jgi:hypothetical protein
MLLLDRKRRETLRGMKAVGRLASFSLEELVEPAPAVLGLWTRVQRWTRLHGRLVVNGCE